MKCKLIEKKLIFYFENELDEKESELIKAHLDQCHECNYLFDNMKQSLNLIGDDILKDSNPFFYTRVAGAIENQKKRRTGRILQKELIFQIVSYTFIVLLAMFAGIYLGSGVAVNNQAAQEVQSDTTDYQLFASSHQFHFSEKVYMVESISNE